MTSRLLTAFGAHEGWERPLHRARALRVDLVVAVVFGACAVLSLDTARSLGSLAQVGTSRPWQYLWLVVPALTLAVRRVLPLLVLVVATAHLVVTAVVEPALSPVFFVQIYYFFALFNAISWSRHRRAALAMTVGFGLVAVAWVLADFVVRDSLAPLEGLPELGPFSPTTAAVLQVLLSTLVFYLSATVGGVLTWWSARREAQAREQAVLIAQQSAQLSERAVSEERLRIARELHDVVGHHIAVIGIQTGAARRVLTSTPDQATEAMLQVERSARSATHDLRLLLSALRVRNDEAPGVSPLHGAQAMDALVESFTALGLRVDLHRCGDLDAVPTTVGLALHRILQESLTNVRRHSTADQVHVRLETGDREGPRTVRLTVTDNGRPRGGTSGSRVGLLGMRERVELHGGTLRTGTTEEGGFQVAVCLSWTEERA
ncbi:sensor histidine kinase [Modestobacter italicus]|uniref:sensor histidine kinase n=1 Tax=Modestobacter italicus (strain DSM 44449 / CECT 9708 / BC 501) TaxID=2732864 RepID=UPI001C94E8C6|nr:sensor histidine kinase [Modestobacter italicus]